MRGALFLGLLPVVSFNHPLFQEPFDESQQSSVGDALAHHCHQPIVWDRVEVALDVHVHDMRVPCLKQFFHTSQRVLATASGAEPVAVFGEAVFEDWLDGHSHRCLHHAVGDRRNTQRSLLRAARLFNPHPFDRLGLIGALLQLLIHGEQPALAVYCEAPYRDAVHAACPCVDPHLFPSQFKRPS